MDGGAREDLNRLKPQLDRVKIIFRYNLEQRHKNPSSLMGLARKSLCSQLGPYTEDWVVQNQSELPYTLLPYLLYNT